MSRLSKFHWVLVPVIAFAVVLTLVISLQHPALLREQTRKMYLPSTVVFPYSAH
jgi:uncharacterized membrane protein